MEPASLVPTLPEAFKDLDSLGHPRDPKAPHAPASSVHSSQDASPAATAALCPPPAAGLLSPASPSWGTPASVTLLLEVRSCLLPPQDPSLPLAVPHPSTSRLILHQLQRLDFRAACFFDKKIPNTSSFPALPVLVTLLSLLPLLFWNHKCPQQSPSSEFFR